MNLNKHHKQAFVRAVLDDVPQVDYKDQAHKLMTEAAIKKMPPKIKAIYEDKELRHYLESSSIYYRNYSLYVHGVPQRLHGESDIRRLGGDELVAALDEIKALDSEQEIKIANIKMQLEATIENIRTLKQLRETFPELVKYMPEEATKTANLPGTNVVSALVQAGWPKGLKENESHN